MYEPNVYLSARAFRKTKAFWKEWENELLSFIQGSCNEADYDEDAIADASNDLSWCQSVLKHLRETK